jgi:superfamily II DNA helicase RecQ
VRLTPAGAAADETTALEFLMKDGEEPAPGKRRVKEKKSAKAKAEDEMQADVDPALEQALRAWRLAEAKKLAVPAFAIFSDKTLRAIAARRPATGEELLAISGMGLSKVDKYGAAIYRIVQLHG